MLRRRPAALALVPLALFACGGGDDTSPPAAEAATTSQPAPTAPTVTTPSTTSAPQPQRDARCLDVDAAKLTDIAAGLTVNGGGTLRFGAAVKSNDFANVYMVAADLEGPDLGDDDDIAIWATNNLEAGAGIIMSVDAMAKEFSDWPDAGKSDAQIDQGADGVSEAKKCAMMLG